MRDDKVPYATVQVISAYLTAQVLMCYIQYLLLFQNSWKHQRLEERDIKKDNN